MRFRLSCVAALLLSGCISTQEMPMAPNMVRIDTHAQGLLFTGQSVPQTMKAAANATLALGYDHFRLAEVGSQQGSVATGVIASSSPGFGTATLVHAPTSSTGATVIMFHADEPGAKDAFDAKQVLAQYSQ